MNIKNKYKIAILLIVVLFFICFVGKFISADCKELCIGKQLSIDTIYEYYKLKDIIVSSRWQNSYKLITLVDSSGCFDCNLKLEAWKNLLIHIDSMSKKEFIYMLITNSNKYEQIHRKRLIYRVDFIYMDTLDIFNKVNKLSLSRGNRTFLVNPDNIVEIIGSPIFSNAITDSIIHHLQ